MCPGLPFRPGVRITEHRRNAVRPQRTQAKANLLCGPSFLWVPAQDRNPSAEDLPRHTLRRHGTPLTIRWPGAKQASKAIKTNTSAYSQSGEPEHIIAWSGYQFIN